MTEPTAQCTFQARVSGSFVEAKKQPCTLADTSALITRGFTGRTYDLFRFDETALVLQAQITTTWTNQDTGPRKQCAVVASPDRKAAAAKWKYVATYRSDKMTSDDPACEKVRIVDSPSAGYIEFLPAAANSTQGTLREVATGCRLPVQVNDQQIQATDTDCVLEAIGVANLGVTRRRYTSLVIDKAAKTIAYRIRTTWTKDGAPIDTCIEGEGTLSDPG